MLKIVKRLSEFDLPGFIQAIINGSKDSVDESATPAGMLAIFAVVEGNKVMEAQTYIEDRDVIREIQEGRHIFVPLIGPILYGEPARSVVGTEYTFGAEGEEEADAEVYSDQIGGDDVLIGYLLHAEGEELTIQSASFVLSSSCPPSPEMVYPKEFSIFEGDMIKFLEEFDQRKP